MDGRRAAKIILPWLVFAGGFALHVWWITKGAASDSPWATLPTPFSKKLADYVDGGAVWLGYTYALSAGFAVWCLLSLVFSRKVFAAFSGVGLAGAVSGFACFMMGCCGSPMLGVWLSLLGASAAVYLGPVAALVNTVSIAAGYFLLKRRLSNF